MSAAGLRRVQSYLRAAAPQWREHVQIGPFLATFSPDIDNPYLNYAIPQDEATSSGPEIQALVEAYEQRWRRPRPARRSLHGFGSARGLVHDRLTDPPAS